MIYEIEGEQVEVDSALTDAEIDEIAATIRASFPQEPSIKEKLSRQVGLAGRALSKAALTGFGVGPVLVDPFQSLAGRQTSSQASDLLLDQLGFPTPENVAERISQTGIETMASIGGQVKGAIGLSKGLQAGSASERVLLTVGDDLAQQIATGVPAAMMADQISMVAEDNNADPAMTAVTALAGGLLAGVVGGKTYKVATNQKIPLFTPEMAKNEARAAYTKVDEAGIKVKPAVLSKLMDDIEINLNTSEGGYYPNAIKEHGQVKSILDNFRNVADEGFVSFKSLDKLRSDALTIARESGEASTRRLMGKVVDEIDLKIGTLQPSDLYGIPKSGNIGETVVDIKNAREAWRRSAKATIIEDALEEAIRRGVAPTGKEGEIIRKKFENLYADKKRMRLFSKDEQLAIKRVAQGGGSLEQLLGFTARFNPVRSHLITGGLAYGATQAPVTAGSVAAAGFTSDLALEQLQKRAARNVLSQIASGKIQKPRSNVQWRALVEAEANALQALSAQIPE